MLWCSIENGGIFTKIVFFAKLFFSKHKVQRAKTANCASSASCSPVQHGFKFRVVLHRNSFSMVAWTLPPRPLLPSWTFPRLTFSRKGALLCAPLSRRVTRRVQRTRRVPYSKQRLFFNLLPALFRTQIIRRTFRPIYMSWDFSVPTPTPLSGSALEAR